MTTPKRTRTSKPGSAPNSDDLTSWEKVFPQRPRDLADTAALADGDVLADSAAGDSVNDIQMEPQHPGPSDADQSPDDDHTDGSDRDKQPPPQEGSDANLDVERDVGHDSDGGGADTDQEPNPPEADDDAPREPAGREAARYRRRLRAEEVAHMQTTAERDALRVRVATMQSGEVERMAAGRLADPGDVWRDGAKVDDVLDHAGNVDEAKVSALVDSLVAKHGHWQAKPAPTATLKTNAQLRSGATAAIHPKPANWASALRGNDK